MYKRQYYHIDGKPVLVVYLTRELETLGLLQQVILEMRTAAAACGKDVYIIGDHVWQAYSAGGVNLLDAVTVFDVYGNLGAGMYAEESELDAYFLELQTWQNGAAAESTAFVPSVTPGFTRRVQNDQNVPLSRRMDDSNGAEGSLFAEMLQRATSLLDSSTNNLLLVNSFNNFHEGKASEMRGVPSDPGSTHQLWPSRVSRYPNRTHHARPRGQWRKFNYGAIAADIWVGVRELW